MADILLLEADSILSGNTKRYLEGLGHSVTAHNDPQEAITRADRLIPDIIIIELQLAKRSGVEFLFEFRSYPDWQDTPVIVLTSLREETEAYQELLDELNVSVCLYKADTSLAQLHGHIETTLQPVLNEKV